VGVKAILSNQEYQLYADPPCCSLVESIMEVILQRYENILTEGYWQYSIPGAGCNQMRNMATIPLL
jgi:hypothetical protein